MMSLSSSYTFCEWKTQNLDKKSRKASETTKTSRRVTFKSTSN
jgi:hypothetical protein